MYHPAELLELDAEYIECFIGGNLLVNTKTVRENQFQLL
jgi:hypothetical protein